VNADTAVGYGQMDEKGRVTLSRPVRQALHPDTGSTLAWITVGEAVLLLPQDGHLLELIDAARAAFERVGLDLEHPDTELEEVRAQVVAEHFGAGFFDELGRISGTAYG